MLGFIDEKISHHVGVQNRMMLAKLVNKFRYRTNLSNRQDALVSGQYKRYVEGYEGLNEIDGYGYIPCLGDELISELVVTSNKIISEGAHRKSSKGFMVNHLENNHLEQHPIFLEIATNPNIIKSAGDYLGCVPILSSIKVLVSDPDDGTKGDLTSSRLFHLDQADNPLFKVIININEVDEDTGPFTFITKSASRKVQAILKSGWTRRPYLVQDSEIFDITSTENVVSLIGEVGDAYFVDSSSCFHYGSRDQKKQRRLLMMSYLSPCRADFKIPFNFQKFRPKTSEVEGWILNPSNLGRS